MKVYVILYGDYLSPYGYSTKESAIEHLKQLGYIDYGYRFMDSCDTIATIEEITVK